LAVFFFSPGLPDFPPRELPPPRGLTDFYLVRVPTNRFVRRERPPLGEGDEIAASEVRFLRRPISDQIGGLGLACSAFLRHAIPPTPLSLTIFFRFSDVDSKISNNGGSPPAAGLF